MSALAARFAGEQTEMLEDEVAGSRLSLNDQSVRRFRGPKKVRFPAQQDGPVPVPMSVEMSPAADVSQVGLTDTTAV